MIKKIMMASLLVCLLGTQLYAQKIRPSTGLTFRFGFWNMGNEDRFLTYIRENNREFVKTAGAGVSLAFTSRTSDYWTFELNLGAFGKAEGETFNHWDEDIAGTAVIPITFGVQRDLLSVSNSSDLRPYVAFGGGPYWITDVNDQGLQREEVISSLDPGAYAGGGINFFLGRKFALNLDGRYHFVDFRTNHDISGLEISFGFSILWGEYKPAGRQAR